MNAKIRERFRTPGGGLGLPPLPVSSDDAFDVDLSPSFAKVLLPLTRLLTSCSCHGRVWEVGITHREERLFIMGMDRIGTGLCAILIIALLAFVNNCANEKPEGLDEEVGFLFAIRGDTMGVEDFVAVTRDEGVIRTAREQLLLTVSQRTLHIHGPVARGNGGHNLGWPWHFLPSKWILTEESTEICDAMPSAVGAWLDSLPDTLATTLFCPLSSYVKAEIE